MLGLAAYEAVSALIAGRSVAATTAGTPPLTPHALSPLFPLLAYVPGTLLCQDLMSTLLPSPSFGLITLLPYVGPGSLKDDGHVQTAQQGFTVLVADCGCRPGDAGRSVPTKETLCSWNPSQPYLFGGIEYLIPPPLELKLVAGS